MDVEYNIFVFDICFTGAICTLEAHNRRFVVINQPYICYIHIK